ncbi:MAG: malate/lactate/ureidoglycolate dehydrogenase [Deltaproteobacteria bacterium]|nr:malate/lactate/ureidoglycolate dehydrogenase [Deltaproteobacteria bacterium]
MIRKANIMLIEAEKLEKVVSKIFNAAGCSNDEAACIARHLVDSNLCGHDSHGVIRVLRYIDFLKEGLVKPGQSIRMVFENETVAVVDGNFGFGQVIGEQTITLLASKAKKTGLAMTALRNSAHLGRLGDWAEQLARERLVSLHFMNTTGRGMLAVPFGGTDRRQSLCPICVCVPVEGRHPVLLDITTSVIAEGKLAVARNKKESVPPGIIVDKDGNPTTDPNDFYAGGALLHMGGHKGYGLNVIADILAGAFSGGGCTKPGVTQLINCLTSIAIDPAPFTDHDAYVAEIKRYAQWVTGSPPKDPDGKVLLPGDIEHQTREQRRREGIPLDQSTWDQILEAGESVGISRSEIEALRV